MELWIRSQDRHNLLKIDRLDVDDYTIRANIKAYDDDGFNYSFDSKKAISILERGKDGSNE